MNSEKKSQALRRIIGEIASSKNYYYETKLMDSHIEILIEVYSDEYRHEYSELFFDIQSVIEEGTEYCEAFTENLKILRDKMRSVDFENEAYKKAQKGISKFFDYINVEVGRYNFISRKLVDASRKGAIASENDNAGKVIDDFKGQIRELDRKVDVTSSKAIEMTKLAGALDSKLEANQNNSLTTLTIFSAVVLAFSGGITFEAGMFKGIAETTPYRLVFAIALSGILLFNIIFMLLYIIGKITGKHISMQCRYMKKTNNAEPCKACGEGECSKKIPSVTALCKITNRFLYVGIVNLIFALVLYYDFVLWIYAGWGYQILGNIELTYWLKIILFVIPFIILTVIVLRELATVYFHKRRIYKQLVVGFLGIYLHTESIPGGIITLLSGVAAAISKMMKDKTEKSLEEKFNEELNHISLKGNGVPRLKHEIKRAIRKFAREVLYIPSNLSICVDKVEHKHNKEKYKLYVTELFKKLLKRLNATQKTGDQATNATQKTGDQATKATQKTGDQAANVTQKTGGQAPKVTKRKSESA